MIAGRAGWSAVAFAALVGCAPALEPGEGRYWIDRATFTLDPLKTQFVNNALLAVDHTSLADGEVAAGASEEATELSGVAELWFDAPEVTFGFDAYALVGAADLDGFTVSAESTDAANLWSVDAGGYRSEEVYDAVQTIELHLTLSDGALHGEGRRTDGEVSGFRGSDLWDADANGDSEYRLDALDEAGEEIVNRAERDDCEGDLCDKLTIDRARSWIIVLDAVPL